jgi:hypothetical protein
MPKNNKGSSSIGSRGTGYTVGYGELCHVALPLTLPIRGATRSRTQLLR